MSLYSVSWQPNFDNFDKQISKPRERWWYLVVEQWFRMVTEYKVVILVQTYLVILFVENVKQECPEYTQVLSEFTCV